MSFALKPIDRRIQRVLERKSKIFSRDTSALETVSVVDISDELKKVQSRTTWMRWISGNENPIVILGGVAHYDEAYNLAKGFDQVYVPPNTSIKYNKSGKDGSYPGFKSRDSSKLFKPLAGVKSISSTFEGATKSLRKTIVNWTVFDLDELETLTPHFLSPGKWCMLEMGWNYAGKVFDKQLIGDKLLKNDTNFEDFSSVEDMIFDNEGDYEILTGVIMNFEYSLRDDGGFDCTTTLGTHGISLLDAGKDSTTYNIDTSLKLSDPNNQNDAVSSEVMLKNNLTTTVNRLDDYFRFSCINPKNTGIVEGKNLLKLGNATDGFSRFYGEPDNWFIYSVVSSLEKDTDVKTAQELADATGITIDELNLTEEELAKLAQTQSQSWVRWGWFEDNVLSKFMGYITLNTDKNKKITGVEDIKLQFRSIDKILKRDAKGLVIPVKKGDENIQYESVRILSHSKMITSDINKFILVGRTPTLKRAEKSDTIRANHVAEFLDFASNDNSKSVDEKEIKKLKPFVIEESVNSITGFQEGYLRNIYFNVNWLKEQLKGTQTLREGLDNILNGVNLEYQQFWDFDITGDENDTTLARIVDRNNPRYNVDNFRQSKINLKNDNNSLYSCYQFPTWTKDSIVSNMDYSVTIPSSQVAVAALSGGTLDSNQPASAKKGDINVQQFVKIMNKSFEDQQDKFFKDIVKISDHFDNSEIEKFGNSSADENIKLESNKGPSILGTVVTRDKEFTNPAGGNAKVDMKPAHEIGVKPIAMAHPYFANPSFDQPNAKEIGGFTTLYTSTGKLHEGGSNTFKEQMLQGLHTDRRTAKTKLVDLLNGIAQIKLTIDGTAGIFPGDAFTSMHLPNHLVKLGIGGALPLLFQATNIEHALGPDGWKTTITGQPRLNSKVLYDDEEVVTSGALGFTISGNTSYAETPLQQKLAYFHQTRNILGINAHFLDKYRMHEGILRVHESDPYWGTGNSNANWSTDFPLFDYSGYKKREEPNCVFDWNNNTNYTEAGKKESYYMAIYEGISVQKAMWHSMYSAILYGIPPEKTYNKTLFPFTSIDKTFNLMSYLMFVSDDLNPTKPTKRYMDSGRNAKPEYSPEFFKRMNGEHFKGVSLLNPTGKGNAGRSGVSGLYSPCQWLKAGGLVNGGKHLQNSVKLSKVEAEKYQKLFKFARIGPPDTQVYEPIGYELLNDTSISCIMRLTSKGRDIYKDFFDMLYKAWIGDDFEENVSLTKIEVDKDGNETIIENGGVDVPKVRDQFGAMFQNSGAGSETPYTDEVFKGSNIHTFNFDKEVDKFLDMMTTHGITIALLLTMNRGTRQVKDFNGYDVIEDTCAKGHKGAQNWQSGDALAALNNNFQSPTDDECHQIYQTGD
jgi:hypothetical protein